MGMYTELFINVDLKVDTPKEVITVLTKMCYGGNKSNDLDSLASRWQLLFKNNSSGCAAKACGNILFNHRINRWSLLGKGDIKNYGKEIEEFFEWIKPYIDGELGDFIGYIRYGNDVSPTLIYL